MSGLDSEIFRANRIAERERNRQTARRGLIESSVLGIDASNIRAGGGVTHLVELLRAADPARHGFSRVVIWGGSATLARIRERPWLEKAHRRALDRGLLSRTVWQRFRLADEAHAARCSVVFVPGGSYAADFRPVVTLSQNLLPFEWGELRRYGVSLESLKLATLRWTQSRAFRGADGVIFLTNYARNAVMRVIKTSRAIIAVIPHGIDPRFLRPPRAQHPIDQYDSSRPFRILYVSQIEVYKHQWKVVEAVGQLHGLGMPVTLELVGPARAAPLGRLQSAIREADPAREFVLYRGAVPYEELDSLYGAADLFVFASSCETFGQVLTEAMSAGLPITCSNRSAMPELLGNGGVYFDPESAADIARALRELIDSPALRGAIAREAFERARAFSWDRCADHTLGLLAEVSKDSSVRSRS